MIYFVIQTNKCFENKQIIMFLINFAESRKANRRRKKIKIIYLKNKNKTKQNKCL